MLGETLKKEILAGNPILVQTSFITASFFGYAHFRTHLPSREGWMFYDDPMSDLGPSWTARWCHHRPNSEPTELNQTGLEPPPLYTQIYHHFSYLNACSTHFSILRLAFWYSRRPWGLGKWSLHMATWRPTRRRATDSPLLDVFSIYKAYIREYPHKIWSYMVQ